MTTGVPFSSVYCVVSENDFDRFMLFKPISVWMRLSGGKNALAASEANTGVDAPAISTHESRKQENDFSHFVINTSLSPLDLADKTKITSYLHNTSNKIKMKFKNSVSCKKINIDEEIHVECSTSYLHLHCY